MNDTSKNAPGQGDCVEIQFVKHFYEPAKGPMHLDSLKLEFKDKDGSIDTISFRSVRQYRETYPKRFLRAFDYINKHTEHKLDLAKYGFPIATSPGISENSKAIKKVKRPSLIIPIPKASLVKTPIKTEMILQFAEKRDPVIIEICQSQLVE